MSDTIEMRLLPHATWRPESEWDPLVDGRGAWLLASRTDLSHLHPEATEETTDLMHARYYSPNLGRFVSVDPIGGRIGRSQTWNRYSYVLNNPVRLIDPDGETFMEAVYGFSQGIGGSLTFGKMDSTQPSPNDTADQRSGQIAGALVVAAVGIEAVATGTGATGGGGALMLASPATGGATLVPGAAVTAGGVTTVVAGTAATAGAATYLSRAASSSSGGETNPGDLKTLSRQDAQKINAENFKKEIVGKEGAQFNVAKDAKGNLYLVPVKKGAGPPQSTGVTWDQAVAAASN